MTSEQQISGDNSYYPHKFDAGFTTLEFLRLSRADIGAATFLDDNNLARFTDRKTVSLKDLEKTPENQDPKGQKSSCSMIFHTAFCCSTLIARYLDIEGAGLSLKEPQSLAQLAHLKRQASGPQKQDHRKLLSIMLGQFAKIGGPAEQVLIKPGNVANNLIADCLESGQVGNIVLLYSSLETFLKSIIKKGLWGQIFARKLFLTLQQETPFSPDLNNNPLPELADLQVAALAWYAQISVFNEIQANFPASRVKSLDCDDFLNAREETLIRLASFLDITTDKKTIEAMMKGSVGERHAKEGGVPFSPEARQAENLALEKTFGEQLQMVHAWASEVARPFNIPVKLDNSV